MATGYAWNWTGSADDKGRGRAWVGDKLTLVHRAVWEFANGLIPQGMLLCHHCDNPRCANPAHLYVGTHRDNMRAALQQREEQ